MYYVTETKSLLALVNEVEEISKTIYTKFKVEKLYHNDMPPIRDYTKWFWMLDDKTDFTVFYFGQETDRAQAYMAGEHFSYALPPECLYGRCVLTFNGLIGVFMEDFHGEFIFAIFRRSNEVEGFLAD